MRSVELISHRGVWVHPDEKNSRGAFEKSVAAGFGIETDLRDQGGQVVISHDVPTAPCMTFDAFLQLIPRGAEVTLALNIKSDGLQPKVAQALAARDDLRCFAFDMSIPDTLGYAKAKLPFFLRMSEYEPVLAPLDGYSGVWLDQFEREWFDRDTLLPLLESGKSVCIVSPELHKRPHETFWKNLRSIARELPSEGPQLMLCTDFPHEARGFFS